MCSDNDDNDDDNVYIYIYMLTQAFQCFAKEADGARSPFFVPRPPKVKSSNAAPRSASMQRPKDGEELRKVEARSTIVAAYSRMGPSCKETNRFCRDGPAGARTSATKVMNMAFVIPLRSESHQHPKMQKTQQWSEL
jgi:hypothetical protein